MKIFKKLLQNHRGLSLVELVVTIAIMSVVSAGIAVAVVSATKNYGRGSAEVDLQQEVQTITNILNNLVVDSIEAKNGGEDGTDSGVLEITSRDGVKYIISCGAVENEDGTIETQLNYTSGGSTFLLSKYVVAFNADISEYALNHSVHFNMGFEDPKQGRNMATAFTTTSRNAESGDTEIQKEDSAVIVVETLAVIEPWQTISIPYDVLAAGDATTDVTVMGLYTDNLGTTSSTSDTALVHDATNKKISITCSRDEMSNELFVIIKTNAVNSEGLPYDTKVIDIKVRRVTGLDSKGSYSGNNGYGGDKQCLEGAIHTFDVDKLYVNNAERYFALSTDTDYVDPTGIQCIITSNISGNLSAYVSVTLNGTEVDKETYFDVQSDDVLVIKMLQDLPKNHKIEIITHSTHSGLTSASDHDTYNAREEVKNKPKSDGATGGRAYEFYGGKYVICYSLFPDEEFKRGDMKSTRQMTSLNDFIDEFVEDYYLDYLKEEYGSSSDEAKQQIYNKIMGNYPNVDASNYINDEIKKKLKASCTLSYFYSVATKPVDRYSYEVQNNQFLADSSGFMWSQYKLINEGEGNDWYRLDEAMALRFAPDKEYEVELVAVLYCKDGCSMLEGTKTIGSKSIVWPYYTKLANLGFGAAGYTFDSVAEKCTQEYLSYARTYPVPKADITFKANETWGLVADSNRIGSEGDPFIIGENKVPFQYDQINWKGTGYYAPYETHIGGILQELTEEGWQDLGVFGAGHGEVDVPVGGFKILSDNKLFHVDATITKSSIVDIDRVFRFLIQFNDLEFNYIKDSDGVFTNKLYSSSEKYDYPLYDLDNDTGIGYFKVFTEDLLDKIYFDYNNGTGIIYKQFIFDKQNQTVYFPQPEWEGHIFKGWYDNANGWGNPINGGQNSGNLKNYFNKTLYAIWIDAGEKHVIGLDANGGNLDKTTLDVYDKGKFTGLPTPTRESYIFSGWYTKKTGGTKVTADTTYESLWPRPEMLYAHWRDPNVSECSISLNSTSDFSGMWVNNVQYSGKNYTYNVSYNGTDNPTVIVTVPNGTCIIYNYKMYLGPTELTIPFSVNSGWHGPQQFTIGIVNNSGSITVK